MVKNKTNTGFSIFFLVIYLLLLMPMISSASEPEGPTNITTLSSTRRALTPVETLSAVAGNVTSISIATQTQTRTWAGYYGNISGTIVLDDGSGNRIYDWQSSNPSGEIYASTSELDFSVGNIECYNFSKGDAGYLSLTEYETSLGLTALSADGINETFNITTDYDPFYVSTTYINYSCPTAYLFNGSNASTQNSYQEVLLYDKTAEAVIFTSIIRQGGIVGFDRNIWDFQMIVAENGHADDVDPTTYYFYVSLE